MPASREDVARWRAACADGSITVEEYARAIAAMREDRYASRPQPKPKKPRKGSKAAAAPAALLDEEAPK
jgi:hypothetical protein